MNEEQDKAREALAALDGSRAKLAAAYDYPFSRHLAFAALMGGLVAIQALEPVMRMALTGIFLISIPLMQRWDRARTGSFLNGYRAGATRKVSLLLLAALMAILAATLAYGGPKNPALTGALALLATLVALGFSYWWQAVYLRELGQGEQG